MGQMMHKTMDGKTPDYMAQEEQPDHGHNTRSSSRHHVVVKRKRTNIGQQSYEYRSSEFWNSLPLSMRNLSRENFKKELFVYLTNRQEVT